MKNTKMLKKNYEFKEVLSRGNYYSGNCIEAFIKKSEKQEDLKEEKKDVKMDKLKTEE